MANAPHLRVGDEARDSAASPDAASFWLLQAAGWAAFLGALVLPWLGAFPLGRMLAAKAPLVAVGLLTTLGLRLVYRRLLRRDVPLAALVAAALAACVVGALAWTAAARWAARWAGPAELSGDVLIRASLDTLGGVPYFALVLAAWSLLYLGISRDRALRAERERSLRAEVFAREARLEALRYQLNPHFLFNALNAVSTLVAEGRNADAGRMISGLSDFLRATLGGSDTDEITVGEEVAFLRRYLEIERVRFGDRLDARIEVEPAVLGARLPSLILQPVVENAVRHAVSSREEGGRITVAARRRGDTLFLSVSDDGPGLGAEGAAGAGIGLSNARARLRHLYGARQRVELLPGDAGGMRAELELPLRVGVRAGSGSRA